MNPMMMKKIQKMQRDMVKAQQEIEQSVFTGSAAGGMVTVEATGTKQINKITINPSVVDPEDVEMLEDMVLAAVKEALRLSQEMASGEMQKITGGMNVPGGLF